MHVDLTDVDVVDADLAENEKPRRATQYFRDATKTIIAHNQSPDVGFETSINPYRGCEHGCIYCFARPTHEYLGFSAGLDFESRIMVKPDAPRLLEAELSSPKWKPQLLMMSGVTDCYQPVERKLKITKFRQSSRPARKPARNLSDMCCCVCRGRSRHCSNAGSMNISPSGKRKFWKGCATLAVANVFTIRDGGNAKLAKAFLPNRSRRCSM